MTSDRRSDKRKDKRSYEKVIKELHIFGQNAFIRRTVEHENLLEAFISYRLCRPLAFVISGHYMVCRPFIVVIKVLHFLQILVSRNSDLRSTLLQGRSASSVIVDSSTTYPRSWGSFDRRFCTAFCGNVHVWASRASQDRTRRDVVVS